MKDHDEGMELKAHQMPSGHSCFFVQHVLVAAKIQAEWLASACHQIYLVLAAMHKEEMLKILLCQHNLSVCLFLPY